MHKKIFLFGTGVISSNYTEILTQLSVEIYGYIDNDTLKWGELFWKKKIYAPDILNQIEDSTVVIACSDINGVIAQLSQLGMENRITSLEYIIRMRIQELDIGKRQKNDFAAKTSDEKTIIIDNLDGSWGGAEDWAHKVTYMLAKRGHNSYIIENTDSKPDVMLKEYTVQIDKKQKNIYEVYLNLVELLIQKRPFTLFNIWGTEVLWAASYVKKLYPEEVFIICNILNDNSRLYQRYYEWDDCIDLYLCISSRIRNNLMDLYKIGGKKICYRTPFIEEIISFRKEYNLNSHLPIRIGYPCRLSRGQKRADLLPGLIENLEKMKVTYELNIAGDGECEKEIAEYVKKNNLDKKVRLYGRLSRDNLLRFLERQDIYLNLSEYEGMSLTMLEAMARGCVPVVTDVSGVDDFIENKKNGLVSGVGDVGSIAEHIFFLEQNRNKLEEYGRKCAVSVPYKCDLEAYMSYIEKLID